MNKRKVASGRPYHHGNVREALIVAAQDLLREQGAAKLSLRAASRRIGVSQAAPYAHFDSRQALLAAVAVRGFHRLSEYLTAAENRTADSAERMHSLARGYVRFAVDQPMAFRLMFGAELSGYDDPVLQAAAQESFAFIQAVVAARLDENVGGHVSATEAGLGAWSLVHGLAMLIVDGKVDWPAKEPERNALVNRVATVYSAGLAGSG